MHQCANIPNVFKGVANFNHCIYCQVTFTIIMLNHYYILLH